MADRWAPRIHRIFRAELFFRSGSAIGSVVNVAARLCASASDREILMDVKVADAVTGRRLAHHTEPDKRAGWRLGGSG
jgi:class 3 adenylate cyclase